MKTALITSLVLIIMIVFILYECDNSDNKVEVERFDNAVRLTLESERVDNMIWHSDSRRLIFEQDDWICIMDSDGDNFTDLFKADCPTISTDGSEVFFAEIESKENANDDNYEITARLWALNINKNNLRDLGEFNTVSAFPNDYIVISPKGKWIAMITIEKKHLSDNTIHQFNHLKIWNIETEAQKFDLRTHAGEMQWSPDGSKLAFSGSMVEDSDQRGIMVVDVNSGDIKNISAGLIVNDEPISNTRSPIWNKDGSEIAFSSSNYFGLGIPGVHAIWVLSTDGSDAERLPPLEICGHHDGLCDWSPNGTHIVLVACVQDSNSSWMRQEIRIVYIDGTGSKTLLSLSPEEGSIGRIRWSPDGTKIAFTIRQDETTDIYVVNVP